MSKDVKFIKGIYSDIDLNEIYDEQEENKTNILEVIALLMLSFFIIDGYMKLSNNEKRDNEKELFAIVSSGFILTSNLSVNLTSLLLSNIANKVYNFHSGKYLTNAQINKIVKASFKGKTFSNRIWNNSNKVSKILKKDIKKFLKGKVSVNDIKNRIEKSFKTEKYNIDRLVNSEVSRVINDATIFYCKENGIKKVQRIVELDGKTCTDCMDYDGEVYYVDDLPYELPQHSNCRCYWRPIIE